MGTHAQCKSFVKLLSEPSGSEETKCLMLWWTPKHPLHGAGEAMLSASVSPMEGADLHLGNTRLLDASSKDSRGPQGGLRLRRNES